MADPFTDLGFEEDGPASGDAFASLGFEADDAPARPSPRQLPGINPRTEEILRKRSALERIPSYYDSLGNEHEVPTDGASTEQLEGFADSRDDNRRSLLEAAAVGSTVPFTGGAGILTRMGVAGAAGAGASLGADALEGEELDPARAAITGAAGALGEPAGLVLGGAARLGAKAVGGAVGLAGKAVRGVAEAAEPYLREKGGELAARAAGIYGRTGVRKAGGAERIADLGNRLIDEGIVTPGVSVSKAGERANALKDSAGETIGELLDDAEQFSYGPRGQDLRGQLEKLATPFRKFNDGFSNQITRIVDEYKGNVASNVDAEGRVPPKILAQLKRNLDAQLQSMYQAAGGKLPKPLDEVRLAMRDLLRKGEQGAVDQLGKGFEREGLEAGEAFRKAKGQYGDAKTVSAAADYAAEGERGNLPIGLTDTIVGTGGGLVPLAAKKLADRFGSSVAGVGARRAADVIAKRLGPKATSPAGAEVISMLEWAQSQSPQKVAAAASVLLASHPELQEEIRAAVDDLLQAGQGR